MQTQTANTLHNAIMEASDKDHPPMLAPGNYVKWKSRIKRYIDTKPNHELIHYCLKNPPYKFTWVDKEVPISEGSSVTTTETGTGYENQRLGNVVGARETVGTMVVQKSRIQCYNCKEFGHVARECQKPKRAKDAAYHRERCYCVSLDAVDSGPIFDTELVQKVPNNDNYNVFAIKSEHSEQSKSAHDTYLIEQDEHIVIIDSLDMSYDRDQIDQTDDDDDLANEHELLASLIEKLKCEIDDGKNRNKFLETSNKDKGIAISELKKLIEKLKGKSVDTKFEKSSVIRQPNAFKSQRPSILGKLTIFSDSLERKDFSKSKSVTKNNVSNDFSKPVTAQILPPNKKSILKNTNVLALGMYKLQTKPTQTRTTQLPNDFRKSNKRVTFSTGAIPTTSVSRPKLKSNPMEDRVLLNNGQGKNQNLKSKTLNVNFVYAACGKCVLNDKHDMCVLKSLDGVNSRTKMPIVVPVSTREPKSTVKQSVAKPLRKTVASESNQKPRNSTRKLYERIKIILFIVNFRCSNHMTGNLKLLINFVEKFLGTVKFRNDQIEPILGYGDLVQGDVTIKRVYYVEGLNHNLFSVGQFYDADLEVAFRKSTCYIRDLKGNDLLSGSRGIYLYSITLQDTTSPNPICLMAKATSSQAWLWHRRLSHLNFDTINLLSKNDIVVGLPKLISVKDHLCSSWILHQTSVARTPEQNGVVKRRNRTLVEAARTMLSTAKVPLFFWAEAIATACFTQNSSLVIPRHEKTPYHIINDWKPSVKFFHIFGSLCYIGRDGENLDKMKEKGDACIFVGYSTQARAYRVFNKRTRVIMETIHVNFDELPQMASDHVSYNPGPKCQSTTLEHDSLSPGPQCQDNVTHAAETVTTSNELDLLFSLMFAELLNGSSQVVSKSSAVTTADAPNQQNAQVADDEFINIFCTPVQNRGETSSRHVDSSNMHTFYQHHPSKHRWTKDHSLEQVIGNPSQSVRTRRQLESDGEICMFALTVSRTEPKNIKEAMADSAWIESMQEELH
nr:hypothetical protein [Tanacetum cinerariifolium]